MISPKSADLIISFTLPIPAFILLSLGIYFGVRASEVFYFSVAITMVLMLGLFCFTFIASLVNEIGLVKRVSPI